MVPKNLTLEGTEGLVLRLGADGNAYTLLLHTGVIDHAALRNSCATTVLPQAGASGTAS